MKLLVHMKSNIVVIKYPVIGWVLYLMFIFIISRFFSNFDISRKFCNYYSLYLNVFFAIFVFINCYKSNFGFWNTVLSSFLFFYICSIIVWIGYIYSESHVLTLSNIFFAILSLFLYPLLFSLIISFLLSSIYIAIKNFIKL